MLVFNFRNTKKITGFPQILYFIVYKYCICLNSSKLCLADLCDGFCKNGGTCLIESNKTKCICPDGYTGDKCEKGKKKKKNIVAHIFF